jgi:hypothetical protein
MIKKASYKLIYLNVKKYVRQIIYLFLTLQEITVSMSKVLMTHGFTGDITVVDTLPTPEKTTLEKIERNPKKCMNYRCKRNAFNNCYNYCGKCYHDFNRAKCYYCNKLIGARYASISNNNSCFNCSHLD